MQNSNKNSRECEIREGPDDDFLESLYIRVTFIYRRNQSVTRLGAGLTSVLGTVA